MRYFYSVLAVLSIIFTGYAVRNQYWSFAATNALWAMYFTAMEAADRIKRDE